MIYKHKNGYSAKLYGKSSMIIFRPNGTQCMHTGSRNVNTEEEVMELLEEYPDFQEDLKSKFFDIYNDNDDCDI